MALSGYQISKDKDFLKNNWKPIVGISAAIGIGIVGYKLYQHFTPPPGGVEEDKRFPPSEFTTAQALAKAEGLYEAMRTRWYSNAGEVDKVLNELQGMTYNDFVKVSEQFGERRYVDITKVGGIYPATPQNLVYWLKNDLRPEDLAAVKSVIPSAF